MATDTIRTDHDSLKQIGKRFTQQAEATGRTIRGLEQAADTLKGGDWIGEGARKFYDEYDSSVLPTIKRLQTALENAAQATRQISSVMQEAEREAARLLGASGAAAFAAQQDGRPAAAPQATEAQAEGDAPAEQTQAEATEARLNDNGITIQSRGNCRDRNNATCTSVEGIREETVDGLIAFREAVGVDLTMTGGTEVEHAAGEFSHGNGYKVDISRDETVDNYIEENFTHTGTRGDGAELYEDADGNVYAREGNHWDITYY